MDRKGTQLDGFLRGAVYGGADHGRELTCWWIFRGRTDGREPGGRRCLGASRAYLVDYSAEDLINWSLDEHGNFEWVVIRTELLKKDHVEDARLAA